MTLLITRRQFEGKDREFIIDNGKYKAGILLDDDGKPCHFTFLNREGHPIGDANVIDGKIENPPYSPSGLVTVTSAGHYEIDGVPFFKISDLQDRLFDGTSKQAPSLGMNIELVDNGYRTTDLVFGKDGHFKDIKQGAGYPEIFVATQIGYREPHSVVSLKNGTLSRNAEEIPESYMQDVLNQFKKEPETFEETLSNGNIRTTIKRDGVTTMTDKTPDGQLLYVRTLDENHKSSSIARYYPNGSLYWKETNTENHQFCERYYKNGQLEKSEEAELGDNGNKWKYVKQYREDGSLKEEEKLDDWGNPIFYASYDEQGRLLVKNERSSRDEKPTIIQIDYEEDGSRKEMIEKPDGREETTKYDADGKVVEKKEKREDGNWYEYKARNDGYYSEAITNPDGTKTEVGYNADGSLHHEQIITPDRKSVTTCYNYGPNDATVIFTELPDGTKMHETHKKDGKKDVITWHPDGSSLSESELESGSKWIVERATDGSSKDTWIYKDGDKFITEEKDGIKKQTYEKADGHISTVGITDANGNEISREEYDEEGKLSYKIETKEDGSKLETHYENGQISKEIETNADGFKTEIGHQSWGTSKSYWQDDQLVGFGFFYNDGSSKEITYGSDGSYEERKDQNGELTRTIKEDKNGNMVVQGFEDGKQKFTMVHDKEKGTYVQYDENGKLQKLVIKEPSGKTKVRTGLRARLSAIAHKTPRRLEQGGR